MKRGLIIAGLCLAVILLVLFFRREGGSGFLRAERTELKLGVEVTGRLQAVKSSTIGPPQVRGVYRFKISMMAPEGKEVHRGEAVLGFDTSELMQKLQARSAEVESARKEIEKKQIDNLMKEQDDRLALAEAEATLRKAELKTAQPTAITMGIESHQTQLDLELARIEVRELKNKVAAGRNARQAELDSLQTRLDRASAESQQTQEAISRMRCTAPRDGIVTYVTDWRNEKKKVGDSVWRNAEVLEIPDLSLMKAEGQVEEALAGHLRVKQIVSFHLDAHPDIEFSGKIASISRTVQEKSWRIPAKVVKVQIQLDESDPEKMRPGMRFRGLVETRCLHDVLTLPINAVFQTNQGPAAFRRSWLGLERVPLNLGPRNAERVVILEGLQEGDSISRTRPDQ